MSSRLLYFCIIKVVGCVPSVYLSWGIPITPSPFDKRHSANNNVMEKALNSVDGAFGDRLCQDAKERYLLSYPALTVFIRMNYRQEVGFVFNRKLIKTLSVIEFSFLSIERFVWNSHYAANFSPQLRRFGSQA